MSAALELVGLTKRFGDTLAVDDVALQVAPGELVSLLGPSGCGKTTTLRMIAGFERPTAGRIEIDGRDIAPLPPQSRGVGMVFQNYALFPHLDVAGNVGFGLRTRGDGRDETARRVAEALALVDLAGLEKRRVQDLSGGQQQRVALARALAPEPPVLLLDEPLSNLDAALRERTRTDLRALLSRVGMTSVFVTHDQEEAFALSDRIAVMRAGRIEQVGTPEELYRKPVSEFVASFVGRANMLPARVLSARGGGRLTCELDEWGGRWRALAAPGSDFGPGDRVRIMLRPEDVELGPPPEHGQGALSRLDPGPETEREDAAIAAQVVERRFLGAVVRYALRPEWSDPSDPPILLASARDVGFAPGDRVGAGPRLDATAIAFPVASPRPTGA